MDKSRVYFSTVSTSEDSSLIDRTSGLFDAADFGSAVPPDGNVAIKMHWGEGDNLAYVAPPYLACISSRVREAGGRPFITDTNTLYRGRRRNAVDNIGVAVDHGFSIDTVKAPVIVADGLTGNDTVSVPIPGKHFTDVSIARTIHEADTVIAVSHVKGHLVLGFGGALKNLGMGCAGPVGKQRMHADVKPFVKAKYCIGCGTCMSRCPSDAISFTDAGKAKIDKSLCIGCAECINACPEEAIPAQWKTDGSLIQEKTAEYALGSVYGKEGRLGFFNFLINITPDCDCFGWNAPPVCADIGILASTDPVAIDQASMDLVEKTDPLPGSEHDHGGHGGGTLGSVHGVDWSVILAHGESLGLGSRTYDLVELG